MKKIISILLMFLCLQVFGQNNIVLEGKIIDSKTKESLSFATVVYQNKSIGTISDADGLFSLSLSNYKESDSIIISYLGYKPIKKNVSECKGLKIYKLEPLVNQLDEVVVLAKSKKIDLKSLIKSVIVDYNKNRKQEPHIAIAHYREKAKEDNKYIMYMESIGYSIFAGKRFNTAPLSNYKFFCENTKSHVVNPEWVKYGKKVLQNNNHSIPPRPSGGSNLNVFRYFELYGVLSKKHYKKYDYKIDSSYFVGNELVYIIKFKGKIAQGAMHIFKNTRQISKIECTTDKYWSIAFNKRIEAKVKIQFNYFESAPFVSSIYCQYKYKGLEYFNTLNILVQKFNDFKLDEDEYWSLNNYNANPYIEYFPHKWNTYNIEKDSDYKIIETDLSTKITSLEEQFVNSSGRWFFMNKRDNRSIVFKVSELKNNF